MRRDLKPAEFIYSAPSSVQEALEILAEHSHDAKILAGGQSLIPAMNFRVTAPAMLVDLNRIEPLSFILREADGTLRIGAMTRQRTVERSQEVRDGWPLLAEAMPHVAHPQIRNRGTIGGSLVHADPAAELPVVMVALGAQFVIKSVHGERTVAARSFFQSLFTVDAQPDEILTEIVIPPVPKGSGSAFLEVARRHGDYAMMGVAALVTVDEGGLCKSAMLAYLNAGETPMIAGKAAKSLVDQRPHERLIAEAARIASQGEIAPTGNLHASADYQRHLADVLTRRALQRAFERAAGGEH